MVIGFFTHFEYAKDVRIRKCVITGTSIHGKRMNQSFMYDVTDCGYTTSFLVSYLLLGRAEAIR